MTDKEVSFRSIIFLVIGILLLLSLIICIYIVNGDRDLVLVEATVVDVKNDSDGTGKNDVTVSYMVDSTFYNYNFYYKDNVEVGDTINVYYHSKNVTSVQSYKVSKLIFVCPVIGLILCVYGLIELFRKQNEEYEEDDFKTKIVSVVGDTEQLKIITDDTQELDYVKTEEEKDEAPIKVINKEENIVDDELIKFETSSNKKTDDIDIIETAAKNIDEEIKKINEDKINNKKKDTNKKVVKIIPKRYYISGTTLVCELLGNESKDINFGEIIDITKTINSEGKLIKLKILSDDVSCLLTPMHKSNLEEVANLIHNKLLTINPNIEEKVEYKEY